MAQRLYRNFFEIAFATADYCLVYTVRFILNHRVESDRK